MDKVVARGYLVKEADPENRVLTFRASTSGLDRHGTIVKPGGIRTDNFDRNPIFLWGHDGYGSIFGEGPSMDSVIGRVVSHRRTDDAFDIDVQFADSETNPKGEQAFRLVRGKFLNTVSVGFIPMKQGEEKIGDKKVPTYEESELLEVSLVPIPSNPEAVALARQMAGPPSEEVDIGLAVKAAIYKWCAR